MGLIETSSGALPAALPFRTGAQEKFITVASTTSTEQSGLFKHLLPVFEKKTGIQVRVVAVGTGQALDIGRRGDADVVFVHAKPLEEKFLAEGHGVKRFDVMYNDFVLIGPKSDPAKVAGTRDIVAAFQKIKAAQAPFVSRGDKSGTHFAELELWKLAGIDIAKDRGPWYRDTGQGMGPALNSAAGMNAYILVRPRHLALVQEPRRPGDFSGGRPAPVQPVRRDAGESGQASAREEGDGPGFRRLGDLAGGPENDRRVQDRRRATLFSKREEVAA